MANERKTIERNNPDGYKVIFGKDSFLKLEKELEQANDDGAGFEGADDYSFIFTEIGIRNLEKTINGEEARGFWTTIAKAIGLETQEFTGVTLKEKATAVNDAGFVYEYVRLEMQQHRYSKDGKVVVKAQSQKQAIEEAYALMIASV